MGEQIAFLIDSRKKSGPLGEYYKWERAKAIMDDRAERFYNSFEEVHEY